MFLLLMGHTATQVKIQRAYVNQRAMSTKKPGAGAEGAKGDCAAISFKVQKKALPIETGVRR